jgi:hypothetical protein
MPNPSPGKRFHNEPAFERPPAWIHESVAALLGTRRAFKRRAILKLLDRLPKK